MRKNLCLILALTCTLCFTAGLSAQDDASSDTDKPKVTKQEKKNKKSKQAEKQKEQLANRIKKELGVELTEDQQKKLMELVGEKREKLSGIQKEVTGIVGKENRKTVATASKEARKEGKSWNESMKIAWTKAGISEDDQAKIVELNKERNEIFKVVKEEIVGMFSEDQKAAMKSKRKKQGKGKGKKKQEEKDLTSVSVSLPGMT